MSNLHDWKKAPRGRVHEYVVCMRDGDTKRMREISDEIHTGNKAIQAKNPGAIARLLGFVKRRVVGADDKTR